MQAVNDYGRGALPLTRDVEALQVGVGGVEVDGVEREVDTVILATGFKVTKYLSAIEVTGRNGVRLDDAWSDGAQAYLGITTSGFPNLFMLYGPNTNLGHGTIIFMIECQIRYIRKCIQKMRRDHLTVLTVDPQAQARFNAQLQEDLAKSVWASGCASWYVTSDGKVLNNWSGFMLGYWRHTLRPNFDEFITA